MPFLLFIKSLVKYVRFQIKFIKIRCDEQLLRKKGNRFRKLDEKTWFSGIKDGQYRGLIWRTTGRPNSRPPADDGIEEPRVFSHILHPDPLKNNCLLLPGGQGFFLSGMVFLGRPLASAGGSTSGSPWGPGSSATEVFDTPISYQTTIITLLATSPPVDSPPSRKETPRWRVLYRIEWPGNGYLAISRNTKLDEINNFFSEFRRNSAEGFCQNFAYFREIILLISRNFVV